MTSARSFFFLLIVGFLIMGAAIAAGAEDGAAKQSSTARSKDPAENTSTFVAPAQNPSPSPGLFFLNGENPRLNLTRPAIEPRSAVLDDNLCYTMRTYKVKRTERLSDNESASRGYSTCELAKNYQVRSAIAHVRSAEETQDSGPQK